MQIAFCWIPDNSSWWIKTCQHYSLHVNCCPLQCCAVRDSRCSTCRCHDSTGRGSPEMPLSNGGLQHTRDKSQCLVPSPFSWGSPSRTMKLYEEATPWLKAAFRPGRRHGADKNFLFRIWSILRHPSYALQHHLFLNNNIFDQPLLVQRVYRRTIESIRGSHSCLFGPDATMIQTAARTR